MSKEVLETIEKLITPVLEKRELSLFDLEYVKEGNDYFLRVFIDKDSGVDLTECGITSELISDVLDEHEPIADAYYLEVSSPGAERPLRTREDFTTYVNDHVNVRLYVNIDGEKEYEGTLTDFTDDIATIEYRVKTRTKEVQIPYEKIAKARLAVKL